MQIAENKKKQCNLPSRSSMKATFLQERKKEGDEMYAFYGHYRMYLEVLADWSAKSNLFLQVVMTVLKDVLSCIHTSSNA